MSMKEESIRMALEIVQNNPIHVTACYNEGTNPTGEQLESFEERAAAIIMEATAEALGKVYDNVLVHGGGEEPVAPSTLLCWLGDRADDGLGIACESIDLEVDR